MTLKGNSSDDVRGGPDAWTPGMRDQRPALPEKSQRRIQRVGIAATGIAATIWLVGAIWAWQVIG
jgi:hypothetical protein